MTKRRKGAQATGFANPLAPSALETYLRLWPVSPLSPPAVDDTRRDWSAPPSDLGLVEDRRRFYPGNAYTGWEPAKRLSGAKPFLQATPLRTPPRKSRPATVYSPSRVAFEVPRTVAICVRRKQRKQVLHALGLAGRKRIYRRRRARRTAYSSIGC